MVLHSFEDIGFAPTLGTWETEWSDPFGCRVGIGAEGMRYRESVIDEYKSRRDPLSICKSMFVFPPLSLAVVFFG